MSRVIGVLLLIGCGASIAERSEVAAPAEPLPEATTATADEPSMTTHESAPAAALCPGSPRVLVRGARHPRVALGRSGAVVTSARNGDPSVDVYFVPNPLEGSEVLEVARSGVIEPGRMRLTDPVVGRLGEEAAAVSCLNDDFCADRIATASERCNAFECVLRVPAHAATVTFALPHQALGVGESFLFDGDILFAAAAAYRGGGMSNVLGFVVTETEAQRVLLHSFGEDDGVGDLCSSFLTPGEDGGAIVTLEIGELAREHRVGLSRDARRTEPGAPRETARRPRVIEHRLSPDSPPFLATYRDGAPTPIDALASDAGRFAPTVVPFGGAFLLVFSEGLRAETRIRAMRVAPDARPLDEGVVVSSPGVEAGRAHVDVLDGVAYLVWEERSSEGWDLVGVSVAECAPSL